MDKSEIERNASEGDNYEPSMNPAQPRERVQPPSPPVDSTTAANTQHTRSTTIEGTTNGRALRSIREDEAPYSADTSVSPRSGTRSITPMNPQRRTPKQQRQQTRPEPPSNGVGGATSPKAPPGRTAEDPTPATRHLLASPEAPSAPMVSPASAASPPLGMATSPPLGEEAPPGVVNLLASHEGLDFAASDGGVEGMPRIPWFLEGHCIEQKHCTVENEDGGMRQRTKAEIDALILDGKIPVGSVKAFLKRKDRVLIKWNAGTEFSDEGEYWKKDLKMIHDPEKKTAWFRRNECDHVVSACTVVYSVVLTIMAFQTAFGNAKDVCIAKAGTEEECAALTVKGKADCEKLGVELGLDDDPMASVDADPQACLWVPADTTFFPFVPPFVCIGFMIAMAIIGIGGIISDVRLKKEHGWGFAIFHLGQPEDPPPEKWLPTGHIGNPGPLNYVENVFRGVTDDEDGVPMIREMQDDADPKSYDQNYKANLGNVRT